MTGARGVERGGSPRFDDTRRALGLFAQALAGRPLRLVPAWPDATAAHLPRAAAEDGTLRVAARVDGLDDGPHVEGALRLAVLRAVAGVDGAGMAGAGAMLRAGAGATAGVHRARSTRPVLLARVFATIERARVDASIERRYPGAGADLARVRAATIARVQARVEARVGVRERLADVTRASLGLATPADVADDADAAWRKVLASVREIASGDARATDSLRIARAIVALLDPRLRPIGDPTVAIDAPDIADPSAPPAAGSSAGGTPDADADPSSTDAHPASVADDGGASPATGPVHATRGNAGGAPGGASSVALDARPDPMPPRMRGRTAPPVARPPARPAGVLVDEWDYLNRRYLRGWCRVHEQRLRGTAVGFADDVRARHPDLARRIRQRFAQMRPTDRVRVRGVGDGDELDLDGIVASRVDRRAGHASDERLYVRREVAARDVAAAFLVDMSASTALVLPDPSRAAAPAVAAPSAIDSGALLYGTYDDLPEPADSGPRRRVIDVAKDALVLMADALSMLGDAHAIYGFSGRGRDDVEFHVAKAFGDALTPSTWAALAAIEPRGSTRMGAAIRHAAAKLARQPASRRLLVVVSDGYPQDSDYGPDRNDDEYGIQDTARALRDAERAGIGTFCVTIDPGGHDYLRRMCPPRRYLVIDDVPELPAALTRVYASLTGRD